MRRADFAFAAAMMASFLLAQTSTASDITFSARNDIDVNLPRVPVAGQIATDQIIGYPNESALRTWLKAQLKAATAGLFVFDDDFE